jgi:hypothetical protein
VSAGRGMPSHARSSQSEGGAIPDYIAEELSRPTCSECGVTGAPRVSIRCHRSNAYRLLCLECAGPAIASSDDLAAIVAGW